MTQDARDTGELPADDALVARLRAAGEHARQLRAPASLQAQLDGAYAAYHAGSRTRQYAAHAPWHGPRWLAVGALASCLVAAVLWQARHEERPRDDGLARTSPAPLAAPPLQAPLRSGPATLVTAPVGTLPVVAAASTDATAASAAMSIATAAATSAATSAALASYVGPHASAGTISEMPSLPHLPHAALPALSLDASALRIATTAPVLPSLTMRIPDGNHPAAPAMPAAEPTEGGGERDAPAVRSTPPSQAVHAGTSHGVA